MSNSFFGDSDVHSGYGSSAVCHNCKNSYNSMAHVHQCLSEERGRRLEPVKSPIPQATAPSLPTDAKERKKIPLWTGLVKYFPDALVAIAKLSQVANDQHNPGQPVHWAREKSTDHHDTLLRHLWESGKVDSDGQLHTTKVAWRALAMLQLELEKANVA